MYGKCDHGEVLIDVSGITSATSLELSTGVKEHISVEPAIITQ